jgi:lysozyme
MFASHWAGIRSGGLLRGAYHFFWPLAAAEEQADRFIATIGAVAPGDLPPVIDIEEAHLEADPGNDIWKTIPPDQRLRMLLTWLNRVESALGRKPIIYSRDSYLDFLLENRVQQLAPYPLWIAHYTNAPQPRIPSTWAKWSFWQYTQKGKIQGIMETVDLDRFNGTTAELKALN